MVTRNFRVIAELVVSPVGTGVSLSRYVKEVIKVIDSFPDISYMIHPMGTVIEADSLDKILEVTKQAHEILFSFGVERVVTTLKIDDRRDKERTMNDKVNAVRPKN